MCLDMKGKHALVVVQLQNQKYS